MAEFYFDNLARNLPDCYKKDSSSNNYKILEIERYANNELRTALEQIFSVIDIDNATGATLDMYGKRFGQARGKATDAQYILMIKSKIIRGLCNGSYKNIVDAICYTFNCGIDDVLITESPDKPMTISVDKMPLSAVIGAGFTIKQACQIIKTLVPITTTVESILIEGTFEFGENEDEYDAEKGFSETVDGEIGGFLGWAGSEETAEDLPI